MIELKPLGKSIENSNGYYNKLQILVKNENVVPTWVLCYIGLFVF